MSSAPSAGDGFLNNDDDKANDSTLLGPALAEESRSEPSSAIKLVSQQCILRSTVQLTTLQGSRTSEHHLYLLKELLVIGNDVSKESSQNGFSYRLPDVWTRDCPIDMCAELNELELDHDCTILLGWPLSNVAATFRDKREKQQWLSALMRYTTRQPRQNSGGKTLNVINRAFASSNNKTVETISVMYHETVDKILPKILDVCSVMGDPSQFRLGVLIGKDTAFLLLGHEYPTAILTNLTRKSSPSELCVPSQHSEGSKDNNSGPMFILLDNERSGYFFKDKLVVLSKKKKFPSVSSKMASKLRRMSTKRKSSPDTAHARRKHKGVFGQPLTDIMYDDILPIEFENLLVKLYLEGPDCVGILRKSPNAKAVKEFRQAMDAGTSDAKSLSVINAGGVVKEFLRAIPGCILDATLYSDWTSTIQMEDTIERLDRTRRILKKLPLANQVVLHNFLVVLARIAENSEINQMTMANLAICVGPSLLWPADGADVLKNEIQIVVQFLINNLGEIFGKELPSVVLSAQAENTLDMHHLSVSVETLGSCQDSDVEVLSSFESETDDSNFRDRTHAVSLLMLSVDGCDAAEDCGEIRSASAKDLCPPMALKRTASTSRATNLNVAPRVPLNRALSVSCKDEL